MKEPLVSVICLCHNQAAFVATAIHSVLEQTHQNVELILVDDGSTDDSKNVIKESLKGTAITFIDIPEAVGNCKAFNRGFKASKGDFIIDLAADDLLLPDRIKKGLETFSSKNIGVEYCDVELINENGALMFVQSERYEPREGNIYADLIRRYFISPPGMMIKRKVLEELDGYDESLSYEDFDFWIRSSRLFEYGFTNLVLVKKKQLRDSLSASQKHFRSKHQKSTLQVCKKIKELNRSEEEDSALKRRIFYEVKQCIRTGNLNLIPAFIKLYL